MKTNRLMLTIPVAEGRLQPWSSHKALIAAFLTKCGSQVKVSFERPSKVRSLPSNRYLWGVIYAYMAAETGHEPEDIHEAMKELFLGRRFIKIGGVEHEIPKSTASLTQDEFSVYMEKVIAFAAQELQLAIPGPGEC